MCKACGVEHPIDSFEQYKLSDGITVKLRTECKSTRAAKRKANVKEAPKKDRSSFPLPEACVRCGKGPTEVTFKFRSDTLAGGYRNECNTCYNSKRYCEEFRRRRREADEMAFLARNAATAAEWRRKNPDAVKQQQLLEQTIPERKLKALVTYAKCKNIQVFMEDVEALTAKFSEPCFYCMYTPSDGIKLNGLDRVHAKGAYSDINTVPCCATCNAIKASHSIDSFLHHARKMYAYSCLDIIIDTNGQRVLPSAFGGRAELRDLEKTKDDHLTDDQRIELWASLCYLCGRGPALGIDRIDSTGDYTVDNVKPCCSSCNYFKKDMSPIEIKTHVAYINAHTAMWGLGEDKLISNLGKEQVPVAAYDSDGTMKMMFPSVSTAARMIGSTSKNPIVQSIGNHGYKWQWVTHSTFFDSKFSKTEAEAFILSARHLEVRRHKYA